MILRVLVVFFGRLMSPADCASRGRRKWSRSVWRNHATVGFLRIDRLALAKQQAHVGRIGPHLVRTRPKMAESGPNPGQIWPKSPQLWPSWAEVGPNSATFDRIRAEFGRLWKAVEISRHRARVGRTRAEFGPNQPNVRRSGPISACVRSTLR